MTKNRVLILSASAGTGHLRAADALARTFRQSPQVDQVLNDDALEYSNPLFRDVYSTLYTRLVKSAPTFVGWWYETSDKPWRASDLRVMYDRLNTGPLVDFIQGFRPNFIVCTHFMPAGVIAHLITRKKLDVHLSIVVTDYDCHSMWLSKAFNRYFVALEETKVHLEALGLPGRRITVSGIPVDPAFNEPVDRKSVLAKHHLWPDKPILLVSAGALGVTRTEAAVKRLMGLRHAVQVIVVCGKNDDLRERVERLAAQKPEMFRVLGFTNEMHKLMRVSTLFVGKPGGLTTSECMVCGLPMVILEPIPGQEDRNSDHLLEKGAAIKCNETTVLPFKIDLLLSDPDRLAAMKASALRLSRPDAAQTIVNVLLGEQDQPSMKVPRTLRKRMKREARGE